MSKLNLYQHMHHDIIDRIAWV